MSWFVQMWIICFLTLFELELTVSKYNFLLKSSSEVKWTCNFWTGKENNIHYSCVDVWLDLCRKESKGVQVLNQWWFTIKWKWPCNEWSLTSITFSALQMLKIGYILFVVVCCLWFDSVKHKYSLFYPSVLLHSSSVSSSSSSSLQVLGFAPVLLGVRITASAFILVAVCPKLNDLTANKHNIQHLASQSHYRSFNLQLDTNKNTRCDLSGLSGADVIFNGWLNRENTHSSWLVSPFKAVC